MVISEKGEEKWEKFNQSSPNGQLDCCHQSITQSINQSVNLDGRLLELFEIAQALGLGQVPQLAAPQFLYLSSGENDGYKNDVAIRIRMYE